MRQIYITTDTHFGHKKMTEYCGRPDNFEELIFKSLQKVPIGNTLIHLGDFCFGEDERWNNKFINENTHFFNKILVKGNHDNKSDNWYLDRGWDFVCDSFSIVYKGKKILFSHEPKNILSYDFNIHGHFHNALPRLLKKEFVVPTEEERNKEVLSILTDKHRLLSLEETNYKPALLETLITNTPNSI
jgi:calcineurin-like phosphoesterase family protein